MGVGSTTGLMMIKVMGRLGARDDDDEFMTDDDDDKERVESRGLQR